LLSKADELEEIQLNNAGRIAGYRQITDEGDLEGVVVEESISAIDANVEQMYESDNNMQLQNERLAQL